MAVTNTTTSGGAQTIRWSSPIPYLFGGLAILLGLIAIALVILACSYRKKQHPASSDDIRVGKDRADTDTGTDVPRMVVIMAGDDKPTYIAMPMDRVSGPPSSMHEHVPSKCANHDDDQVF